MKDRKRNFLSCYSHIVSALVRQFVYALLWLRTLFRRENLVLFNLASEKNFCMDPSSSYRSVCICFGLALAAREQTGTAFLVPTAGCKEIYSDIINSNLLAHCLQAEVCYSSRSFSENYACQ